MSNVRVGGNATAYGLLASAFPLEEKQLCAEVFILGRGPVPDELNVVNSSRVKRAVFSKVRDNHCLRAWLITQGNRAHEP